MIPWEDLQDTIDKWAVEALPGPDAAEARACIMCWSDLIAQAVVARIEVLSASEKVSLRKSLERVLLEIDLLVEDGTLPDIRNDVTFVEARAALHPTQQPPHAGDGQ